MTSQAQERLQLIQTIDFSRMKIVWRALGESNPSLQRERLAS